MDRIDLFHRNDRCWVLDVPATVQITGEKLSTEESREMLRYSILGTLTDVGHAVSVDDLLKMYPDTDQTEVFETLLDMLGYGYVSFDPDDRLVDLTHAGFTCMTLAETVAAHDLEAHDDEESFVTTESDELN